KLFYHFMNIAHTMNNFYFDIKISSHLVSVNAAEFKNTIDRLRSSVTGYLSTLSRFADSQILQQCRSELAQINVECDKWFGLDREIDKELTYIRQMYEEFIVYDNTFAISPVN